MRMDEVFWAFFFLLEKKNSNVGICFCYWYNNDDNRVAIYHNEGYNNNLIN